MEYFIPAWHSQLVDWAYNLPLIEIYDDVNYMRVLKENKQKIGLVLTDYQPQLTTKLNHTILYPDRFFSVYDSLQNIHGLDSRVIDFRDFNWPEDISFDLSPFRILAISQNRVYAKIIFDSEGKILYIQFVDEDGNDTRKLILDSRGFVSAEETADQITYYDPQGHWRFIYNKNTDAVKTNSVFNVSEHEEYPHLKDLIQEVLVNKFLAHIQSEDRLIITIDDRSLIPLSVYKNYNPIYTANKWHKFSEKIKQVENGQVLVVSKREIEEVKGMLNDNIPVINMPSYPIRPNLGHSQRLKRQITAVFAENTTFDELKQIVAIVYKRMIKNPDGEGLYILTYSNEQDDIARRVLEDLEKEHGDEFTTEKEAQEQGDNQIEASQYKAKLYIRKKRISSVNEAYKILDKVRILINWGHSDDFIQTAAISIGIPQLQNFSSSTLNDHENGLICQEISDLSQGLAHYLDNLQVWNQALVFDVKLLNQYSSDNLMAKWKKVLNYEA